MLYFSLTVHLTLDHEHVKESLQSIHLCAARQQGEEETRFFPSPSVLGALPHSSVGSFLPFLGQEACLSGIRWFNSHKKLLVSL